MSDSTNQPSETFDLDVFDDLPPGQRWSTWDEIGILAGPEPWPDWVITESAAIDTELGILKTGKEADVFLLERATPDRSVVLAAKRYRSTQAPAVPSGRRLHRGPGHPPQPRPVAGDGDLRRASAGESVFRPSVSYAISSG